MRGVATGPDWKWNSPLEAVRCELEGEGQAFNRTHLDFARCPAILASQFGV